MSARKLEFSGQPQAKEDLSQQVIDETAAPKELAATVLSGAKSKIDSTFNKRILIVEDESEIGERIKEILSPARAAASAPKRLQSSRLKLVPTPTLGFEFEVDLALNAEAALKLIGAARASGKPYTMGFFDVLLGPGMDGYELFKQAQIILPEMQAVFVTAYNDRSIESIDNLFGAEHAASWDYLNKPFTRGEILQKARNFVSLWNLKEVNQMQSEVLADNHQRLMEGERHSTMVTMAAGLSHEFGNLLMQIVGQADLSLTKDEASLRTAMHRILEASDRASQVLGRFKDLASGPQVALELTSLNQIMDEAMGLLDHQFRRQKIHVVKDFEVTRQTMLDATGLLQVIVNLTINAVFAVGDGGELRYYISEDENYLKLKIRDNGPGVSERVLEQMFQSFFTTKEKEGTGLGLAICRDIIENHHEGSISARNHPEGGLEVEVLIPLQVESCQSDFEKSKTEETD